MREGRVELCSVTFLLLARAGWLSLARALARRQGGGTAPQRQLHRGRVHRRARRCGRAQGWGVQELAPRSEGRTRRANTMGEQAGEREGIGGSLRPVEPIAGVAKSGDDVAVFIEPL